MAMDGPDKDERSEPASAKKREDSRGKGMVAKSMDLNSAAVLLFGYSSLLIFGSTMSDKLSQMFRYIFTNASFFTINVASVSEYFSRAMMFLAMTLLPVLTAFFVIGAISNIAQVGVRFSSEALRPKFAKMNPLTGIKRIFMSVHSLVELGKGIAKSFVVAVIAYSIIDHILEESIMLVDSDVRSIIQFIVSSTSEIVFKVGAAFGIIAASDFFYQRYEHEKNLRMTKQEVKDEFKTSEGDPQIKGRIKSIQRQIAYKRMMSDVPKADVVITNPTHFAIALKYETNKMTAPKVLAKGADIIAQKIKEIAKINGVPIVEDKPLAQALYKSVDVGDEIPEKLFHAVAQILAYIYKLKNTKSKYSLSA
jgi:flagellar biosynthesis protein FlhB